MMTDQRFDRISVIIPTLNESEYIAATLASALCADDVEVIVVDGASTDDTVDKAMSAGARVITGAATRSVQMNAGAAAAKGDVLVFLHADTRLPAGYAQHIRRALSTPGVVAGAFELAIDGPGRSLRIMERVANWRSRYLKMPYGDQALFVSSRLFSSLGGFPEQPIMEDFVLNRRLTHRGRIIIVSAAVATSARRWQKLGPWRTWLVNQAVVCAFYMGVSPDRLAAFYRRVGNNHQ